MREDYCTGYVLDIFSNNQSALYCFQKYVHVREGSCAVVGVSIITFQECYRVLCWEQAEQRKDGLVCVCVCMHT